MVKRVVALPAVSAPCVETPSSTAGINSPTGNGQEIQPTAARRRSKFLDPGVLRGALVIGILSAVIGGVIVCALYPVIAPVVARVAAHLWSHITAALL